MAINRKFFFDFVRVWLFDGKLKPGQVNGMILLLDVWENTRPGLDRRWLAYALGTAYHETAHTMQPIDEYGGVEYFKDKYDVQGSNPQRARAYGNTVPGDGVRFHGRGFVQLTWKKNYIDMERHLSSVYGKPVPLVNNPDLAKDPFLAAEIMFFGMTSGAFTGKSLPDYFSIGPTGQPDKDDWFNARRIVNGIDRAAAIADHGRKFYAAVSMI